MNTPGTPVSKYAGAVATGVWTLGWIIGAAHAVQHVKTASNPAVMLNLFVTFACAALGGIMTYRIARPRPELPQAEKKPEAEETWLRRLTGWIGLLVWCAVAVIWNLSVFRVVARSATDGQAWVVLLLLPFSVIGWFLLNLLCVSIGVILDPLFARDETVKRWP
ncbi:MAG: hypothetical protein P4N60_10940 [Verrucomicrobiae bacterium]|nr:hypothetical protein [Verrucomicrobiae bacterium]